MPWTASAARGAAGRSVGGLGLGSGGLELHDAARHHRGSATASTTGSGSGSATGFGSLTASGGGGTQCGADEVRQRVEHRAAYGRRGARCGPEPSAGRSARSPRPHPPVRAPLPARRPPPPLRSASGIEGRFPLRGRARPGESPGARRLTTIGKPPRSAATTSASRSARSSSFSLVTRRARRLARPLGVPDRDLELRRRRVDRGPDHVVGLEQALPSGVELLDLAAGLSSAWWTGRAAPAHARSAPRSPSHDPSRRAASTISSASARAAETLGLALLRATPGPPPRPPPRSTAAVASACCVRSANSLRAAGADGSASAVASWRRRSASLRRIGSSAGGVGDGVVDRCGTLRRSAFSRISTAASRGPR